MKQSKHIVNFFFAFHLGHRKNCMTPVFNTNAFHLIFEMFVCMRIFLHTTLHLTQQIIDDIIGATKTTIQTKSI